MEWTAHWDSPVIEYKEAKAIKEEIITPDVAIAVGSNRIGDKVFRRFVIAPSASMAENFDDVYDFLLDLDEEALDDDCYMHYLRLIDDLMINAELDNINELRRAKKTSARKRRLAKQKYRATRTRILQKRKRMRKSARGQILLRKRKQMAKSNRTATGRKKATYHRPQGGDKRKK